MTEENQNKNLQTPVPTPRTDIYDDDFAIPELTVKDESGQSQKVTLTAAPAPSPAAGNFNDEEADDQKKKLDEFRTKANVLNSDLGDQVVLADLEARAKADKKLDGLGEVPKPVEEAKEEAPSLTAVPVPAAKDRVESEEPKTIQPETLDQKAVKAEEKIDKALGNLDSLMEEKEEENELETENKASDDEPVLANPVAIAPKAEPTAMGPKKEDDLIPEIDLDAEDVFAEDKAGEEKNSAIEKVNVKTQQELAREKTSRKAVVQNIMKTETIYDRKNKGQKGSSDLSTPEGSAYKTLTPVEELEVLSLEEWRRLGDIPEERIAKIKEKIELLGEKGILSQIKGLNSWRRSPVMQNYLDLGIQALLDKKGVEEYMENIDDDKNLSYQEWMAINKLNSQLMI